MVIIEFGVYLQGRSGSARLKKSTLFLGTCICFFIGYVIIFEGDAMSGNEANKKYRDSVFCSYFNEPMRLLSLCNAILNTDYQDTAQLKINTLEGIFFDDQKNDISCTLGNNFLVLIEHQSSVNENMPLRCLSYVAELLNKLITDKQKIYRKALIKFPAPRFIVLYNGDDAEPLQREMRLSEAFDGDGSALELVVTSYNINHGLNQPLLGKCPYLNDYSLLIGEVKSGLATGLNRREAIRQAVKNCLTKGIMGKYLVENSEEVTNMLSLEWNLDDALQARFEDGRDEGIESIALNLLNMGLTVEKIQEATKLSIERIKELANGLKS